MRIKSKEIKSKGKGQKSKGLTRHLSLVTRHFYQVNAITALTSFSMPFATSLMVGPSI